MKRTAHGSGQIVSLFEAFRPSSRDLVSKPYMGQKPHTKERNEAMQRSRFGAGLDTLCIPGLRATHVLGSIQGGLATPCQELADIFRKGGLFFVQRREDLLFHQFSHRPLGAIQ